jgi:hypothetical protein
MILFILCGAAALVVSALLVINARRDVEELQFRNANLKYWLDTSATDADNLRNSLEVAYRTIDKMQDKIDGTSFAEDLDEAIDDNITNAGVYFDAEGAPLLDQMDWTPQEGETYSESDDSDV